MTALSSASNPVAKLYKSLDENHPKDIAFALAHLPSPIRYGIYRQVHILSRTSSHDTHWGKKNALKVLMRIRQAYEICRQAHILSGTSSHNTRRGKKNALKDLVRL